MDCGHGIWKIILQFCLKHYPAYPQLQEDESVRELVDAVNNRKQEEWLEKNLSSLEEAHITEAENYEFQIFHDEEESEDDDDSGDEQIPPSQSNIGPMSFQPPAKRMRRPSGNRKTCCIKGCQNSYVWSNKMGFVSQV